MACLVSRIYKEDNYTLLNTKHKSSWPCGFREIDYFMVSHCKSMGVICCHGDQSSDTNRPKT